ncbi:MAG: hypothetical protein IPO35_06500 [Uliginosibacterium sp.]|nr:hypothetical protein [Uliginosibacterium sp.]
MIRALLLLFLALILPAAHAASDTQTGVWRGQIGRLDVIACFDNGNWGRYYYLANGHTLNLAPDDGFWREFAAKDAGLTGRWELSDPVKKRIVGEWTTKDGAHPTPIRLRSIPLQKVTKSPYPCENPAFIAPLRAMTPMTKGKYFQLGGLAWHDVSVKSVKGRKLSGVVLDETIPSPLGKALKTRLDNGVDNLLTCGGDTIWLDMLDYDSTERIAYVTPTQGGLGALLRLWRKSPRWRNGWTSAQPLEWQGGVAESLAKATV